MREIVGFVMGAAAGAAGALFVSSTEGRALLERLRDEARPEVDRATTEWEPVLREVGRAVRLAARELETATADLRSRIGEIAAALPAEATEQAGQEAQGAPHDAARVDATDAVEIAQAEAPAAQLADVPAAQPAVGESTTAPPPVDEPMVDDTAPGA